MARPTLWSALQSVTSSMLCRKHAS
jgi:hypothetical protein